MNSSSCHTSESPIHTVVLVGKVPTLSMTKTRLIPSIGELSTLMLCQSMIKDTLSCVSCQVMESCELVWYFAPSSDRDRAEDLLNASSCAEKWRVMPMPDVCGLRSTSLTDLLKYALLNIPDKRSCSCTLIGSDTPHLPFDEIARGQKYAENGQCYICPAEDGGYVLLTVPLSSELQKCSLFDEVEWSSPNTLTTQIQALERSGFSVIVGNTYRDVDDIDDLRWLWERRQMHIADKSVDDKYSSTPCQTLAVLEDIFLRADV